MCSIIGQCFPFVHSYVVMHSIGPAVMQYWSRMCSIGPPDMQYWSSGCAVLVHWICSIGPPDMQYWSTGYAVLVHWICSIGPMDMSKIKPECFRLPKNTYLSKIRPNVIIRGHICAFCEVFVLSQCLTVRVSELLSLNMSY